MGHPSNEMDELSNTVETGDVDVKATPIPILNDECSQWSHL